MRKKLYFLSSLVVFSTFTSSCINSSKEIDPNSYPITAQDRTVMEIPNVCKSKYENMKNLPKVAVLTFTNNTTFDVAKVVQSKASGEYVEGRAGVAAVGVAPGVAVGGYQEVSAGKISTKSESISRQVNAKLGESITEAVASAIVEMGGAKVLTRQDLDKILQEQKFQQSGLVDDKTAVQIGKLSGAKYIITGSINNVEIKWVDLEDLKKGAQKYLGVAGSLLAIGAATQEGWNISTDMTIKVIDVETGEVVFSKQVSGRKVIGKVPNPNYDTIIGGVKGAAKNAVESSKEALAEFFAVKGYIVQLRTNPSKEERYALINLGSKFGVKPGQEFFIYEFQEVHDPISGKRYCEQIKLPVSMIISNQVQPTSSWGVISGDKNQIMRVKIGMPVKRASID
jgi:curli biogenesis system outer membrane secretion channel CsgG